MAPAGMTIRAPFEEAHQFMLSAEALQFLADLHRRFNAKRKSLLVERAGIQEKINHGWKPDFMKETAIIRNSDWTIAPVPADLLDRRVEITGPVDRKMIINALNSGANVFMADFEDSNTPNWQNTIGGQLNLFDAIRKNIRYENPENGKTYQLNETTATLFVRPRGWHLEEKNILVDDEPMSGSLVDFGLYFFHNAQYLLQHGSGPYFYLPKLEHYREARLWDDVFVFSQNYCGVPYGSIKATVLVETILASFQLNEILWELRDHSAGLNCGRWDYIFSFIKKFRQQEGTVFPDRSQVTMTVPFMRAYSHLVIQTCHLRGAHAIGGMAAQIPIRSNPEANEKAMEKVMNDKLREVTDGHDGTWVAHPALVPIAMDVFNQHMPGANQVNSAKQKDFSCTANMLLEVPGGTITEEGMRTNINVGILYLESWLRGNGAAAIYNLMEDAATAEISRSQLWQWIRCQARLNDGRTVNQDLYETFRDEEIVKIRDLVGSETYCTGKFTQAIALFNRLVTQPQFEEFLTIPAYSML
ncbi:malate synthase A [Flavihumibacter stibioxidans]|uniref:Malate synthase n=2 Tax=Flavihumibacter stibioxidans TaxID=1834163 RepID=A0ABR7M5W6_9BACT|nr:malate synthase A [Flavihumibacter stibioxidans]